LIEAIWQRTSLSRQQFDVLYMAPVRRYAELVQQFPASESHHHAYPGGMLDHGLETVSLALKLRQSHLLPTGAIPEDQASQEEAWTAAVAYAALLHDLGKIAVDLHVEQLDGSIWHPWHGPLRQPYRFRYRAGREYRLHGAAAGLLYAGVLGGDILDWMSGTPALWPSLIYVLAGQHEHAGMLGELAVQADRASVAQALGGDPAKALAAPQHALQRKLLDGLRTLLKEGLKLNQPGASDGWLTQDALWLVSKTVADKLRAHLLSQGIDGIPAGNGAVFGVLQEHGIVLATPEGKAIWKATVTHENGWSHSFTFLKVAPATIWAREGQPAPFAGSVEVAVESDGQAAAGVAAPAVDSSAISPVTPVTSAAPPVSADGADALLALFDAPEPITPQTDTAMPEPVPDISAAPGTKEAATPSGAHFMVWLRARIAARVLIINEAKALVHTVDDTAYLVTPLLFQRYVQEHPAVAALAKEGKMEDWRWAQKQFEKLGLHRKQDNGLNIWLCSVTGPRKSRRLHGYLLADPKQLFDEVPPDNPYLRLENGIPAGAGGG
jgi:integrating conjugative element relaxase (TIGR03760 family)